MSKQVMETLEECKDIFEAIPAIAPTHIELISQCIETNEKVKQVIAQLEGQETTPPAPVRLTDEEIEQAAYAATRRFIDVESARAVITAHEANQRGGV